MSGALHRLFCQRLSDQRVLGGLSQVLSLRARSRQVTVMRGLLRLTLLDIWKRDGGNDDWTSLAL